MKHPVTWFSGFFSFRYNQLKERKNIINFWMLVAEEKLFLCEKKIRKNLILYAEKTVFYGSALYVPIMLKLIFWWNVCLIISCSWQKWNGIGFFFLQYMKVFFDSSMMKVCSKVGIFPSQSTSWTRRFSLNIFEVFFEI